MPITDFELLGNVRLGYRGIKSVAIHPVQKLQMILGTNGSGKSTVMDELSPLAAKPGNYIRGGFKKTTHTRRGHTYDCISDFRGTKNHFAIEKDGVVLYSGHSSEAYNAYVSEEFKLTPELHEIRTGRRRLTTMETDARRKWFTKIAPEDYTYAIGYYKRLSEATRDLSGTIKRLNVKLLQERDKLISETEEASMRAEISAYKEQKSHMMQFWRPMQESVDDLLRKIDEVDTEMLKLADDFTKSIRVFCNPKALKDSSSILEMISDSRAKVMFLDSEIQRIFEKIESTQALVDQARVAVNQDEGELNRMLAEVSREMISTSMTITSGEDWTTEPVKALHRYDGISSALFVSMNELIPDPNGIYTPAKYSERHTELNLLTVKAEVLQRRSRELSEKISLLEHRRDECQTVCPKCSHAWSKGFNEVAFEATTEEHKQVTAALIEMTEQINVLTSLQQVSYEQLTQYNVIDRIVSSSLELMPMWRALALNQFMRSNPEKAIEYVKSIRTQIELNVQLSELRAKRENLDAMCQAAKAAAGLNQKELNEQIEKLNQELWTCQNQRAEENERLVFLQNAKSAMEFQDKLTYTADNLLMKRDELVVKAEHANHHEVVNSIIMYIDNCIAQKERQINQIDAQHLLIDSIEKEVQECKNKEILMRKAMDTLSPSKGLIALGLTGFINHFIAQMNAVIEKVWLYPLTINPITVSDEDVVELDYKFSFNVDDNRAGDDVKNGSGAQMEIFDLAFMLVSMMHCDMADSEIFLDEFSIRMDYAHRREAMKMVSDLLLSSNFSQIFMISHYESSYGTMSDADITVLCEDNILLPSGLPVNNRAQVTR